jgi:hypothetical protein
MIESKPAGTKFVYFFGGGKADGNGKMKDVLGGKGAGLAETTVPGRLAAPAAPFRPLPRQSAAFAGFRRESF